MQHLGAVQGNGWSKRPGERSSQWAAHRSEAVSSSCVTSVSTVVGGESLVENGDEGVHQLSTGGRKSRILPNQQRCSEEREPLPGLLWAKASHRSRAETVVSTVQEGHLLQQFCSEERMSYTSWLVCEVLWATEIWPDSTWTPHRDASWDCTPRHLLLAHADPEAVCSWV